jgi:hypothetical protein
MSVLSFREMRADASAQQIASIGEHLISGQGPPMSSQTLRKSPEKQATRAFVQALI